MEKKAKLAFKFRINDINHIFNLRKVQMKSPKLTFSIFDPLRNEAPRKIRLEKFEKIKELDEILRTELADFLAPYIIEFPKNGKPTKEESSVVFNNCLDALKQQFLSQLNELQQRYDEASVESRSMRQFLEKFQEQFENFDFDNLMAEG